jgi:sulfur-oxidizing protein SoxZ
MSKPRIKFPETAKAGDIIEIKTLMSHVMETGQRRDAEGKIIPRDIINSLVVSFAGQEFFRASLQPGISANPYISFYLRVPGPGDIKFIWTDDAGKSIVEEMKLNAPPIRESSQSMPPGRNESPTPRTAPPTENWSGMM